MDTGSGFGPGATSSGGGQQYTSSVSWAGGASDTVDPFIGLRNRFDQKPAQNRAAPGTSDSSTLCWGGPPEDDREFRTTVKNRKPTDPPARDEDDPDTRIVLRERDRVVERIDIASDDDADVIIRTERIRVLIMDGSDGKEYVFEFKPDGKKTSVPKGTPVVVR